LVEKRIAGGGAFLTASGGQIEKRSEKGSNSLALAVGMQYWGVGSVRRVYCDLPNKIENIKNTKK